MRYCRKYIPGLLERGQSLILILAALKGSPQDMDSQEKARLLSLLVSFARDLAKLRTDLANSLKPRQNRVSLRYLVWQILRESGEKDLDQLIASVQVHGYRTKSKDEHVFRSSVNQAVNKAIEAGVVRKTKSGNYRAIYMRSERAWKKLGCKKKTT